MRVLYDPDAFDRQRVGGVSRYFTELISTMRKLRLAKATMPFFLTENRHLAEKRLFPIVSVPSRITWRHKSYYKTRINRLTTGWALQRNIADVFHMTFYDISLLPLIRCPLVVTAYDMIPELLPHYFPHPTAVHPDKKAICERADAVICISHNTKSDLVRLFDIDPRKVFVAHLGISQDWSKRPSAVPDLPSSFLLFVGQRGGYKNFSQVVDALACVSRHYPDLHLVCVGGGRLTESELETVRARSVLDRVHQLDLTDRELAYCYSRASAFVFPSLYEGFGIPILESFISHCPAILSNRSCFPEIGADAAQYFEPDVADSLADSIDRVLQDRNYRATLIERGEKRVSSFTWQKTAAETAKIYRALA